MELILIATTIALAGISALCWIAVQVYKEIEFRAWLQDMSHGWEDDGNTEE